jgi:outer membrane lipoprotein SlyB
MIAALLAAVAMLAAACTNPDSRTVSSTPSTASGYPGTLYGVIDAIEVTSGEAGGIAGSGIGAGAVIGGVVGGVLGHQVGGGSGQDIATAAGVVGGAVAGHEIEKRTKDQQEIYHIRVRLDNGNYHAMIRQSIDGLRVGDRVRIENDNLYRY